MRSAKKYISSSLCIFLVILFNYIGTSAVTLNVSNMRQLDTKLCWVTAAKMVGDYLVPGNGNTIRNTVIYIKGRYVNEGGNEQEHRLAINYITNRQYSYARATSGFNGTFIKNSLNKGYPLTVGVTGHVYVLRGYDDYINGGYLTLNDPWTGTTKQVMLDYFVAGEWSDNRPYNDHFYKSPL
ncbi:MAG: papain-like cysteine protease family protein [Oscillospiraceae bacterium]|jgi:hypothetical protein